MLAKGTYGRHVSEEEYIFSNGTSSTRPSTMGKFVNEISLFYRGRTRPTGSLCKCQLWTIEKRGKMNVLDVFFCDAS